MSSRALVVEITRGDLIESRHRVSVAVAGAGGDIIFAAGDVERLIFPRSAIKPIQALALIESGAAEQFGISGAEIALACASHTGSDRHVVTVRDWLGRLGLAERDLECGAHWPFDNKAANALVLRGLEPSTVHNNCSGKHAGFLTLARQIGVETAGYIRIDHPVQIRVRAALELFAGARLTDAPTGIDGCGIPVHGMPLTALAIAIARLADPANLPDRWHIAAGRVRAAMAAEPEMVAGRGRFATNVIAATEGRALVKPGAEGVSVAALPGRGLGIALKAEDGATRAAEAAMGHMLVRLEIITADAARELADQLQPRIRNWAGTEVGRIRVREATDYESR